MKPLTALFSGPLISAIYGGASVVVPVPATEIKSDPILRAFMADDDVYQIKLAFRDMGYVADYRKAKWMDVMHCERQIDGQRQFTVVEKHPDLKAEATRIAKGILENTRRAARERRKKH